MNRDDVARQVVRSRSVDVVKQHDEFSWATTQRMSNTLAQQAYDLGRGGTTITFCAFPLLARVVEAVEIDPNVAQSDAAINLENCGLRLCLDCDRVGRVAQFQTDGTPIGCRFWRNRDRFATDQLSVASSA